MTLVLLESVVGDTSSHTRAYKQSLQYLVFVSSTQVLPAQ